MGMFRWGRRLDEDRGIDAEIVTLKDRQKMRDQLARIEALARRHWHPGCNTGAQTLAGLIVKICEEQ